MADYFRREVTTKRVEYVVPMKHSDGINWVEVQKAIQGCIKEMESLGLIKQDTKVADDQITMIPGDEDIVVRFVSTEAVRSDG
jgi:hypothetical protein